MSLILKRYDEIKQEADRRKLANNLFLKFSHIIRALELFDKKIDLALKVSNE